jgi:MscS family membrane protein
VAGREAQGAALMRVATPLLALLFLHTVLPRLNRALVPFSQMPDAVALTATLLSIVALAWLFWSATQAVVELRIRSRRHAPGLPDLELMRVVGVIFGALGVLVIVTAGAQRIGIPIVSLAAGLGIGGLAVALAVRPTLENLVGGLLLFIDKPVRIGDFCTFGPHSGTVERIGIRAVKVRALDRTLISIPNARFADMELVNWAACDMMLIHTTLRLRLETSADQLRYVLAEIRRMLHSHPRIDDDTIRVRYLGPSTAGRDIDLRFYARTREWNEFFAIREDTFLRIDSILQQAGARTAVPAQVLHVGRDAPADTTLREAAEAHVAAWRQAGRLPFPKFSAEELTGLDGTLDYPPTGSPDAGSAEPYRIATPEKLSQEPESKEPDTQETARKDR